MGLNENYEQARSQILMSRPTPSLNKAYAMIIERESQKFASNVSMVGESSRISAFMTGKGKTYHTGESNESSGGRNNGSSESSGGGTYESGDTSRGRNYQMSTSIEFSRGRGYQKSKKYWNLFCDVCKLKGHTEANCYKIIGYPADFKFRTRRTVSAAYNMNTENYDPNVFQQNTGKNEPRGEASTSSTVGDLPRPPQFTSDKYDHIMKMLNKTFPQERMANMAGPFKWEGQRVW